MELRQLEIFRVLARELNFTRTAERVHCVQSNVTVQIRALEAELGTALFERLGKQVRLTEQGSRLLPFADRVMSLLDQARLAVASDTEPRGTLSVGSPESVLTYRLPIILQAFCERYPAVELAFRPLTCGQLWAQLERGGVDLLLNIGEPLENPRLHIETLCSEEMVLLVRPDHRLANYERIFPGDLTSETLLLTEDDCAYRRKLERILTQSSVVPASRIEFASVEAIKQCAVLGVGVAFLPAMVASVEIEAGRMVVLPWAGPSLTMETQMAWHKDKWHSAAMDAFIASVRNHFSDTAIEPMQLMGETR
jgi:DNA-binding transcriptional LysR family regulator